MADPNERVPVEEVLEFYRSLAESDNGNFFSQDPPPDDEPDPNLRKPSPADLTPTSRKRSPRRTRSVRPRESASPIEIQMLQAMRDLEAFPSTIDRVALGARGFVTQFDCGRLVPIEPSDLAGGDPTSDVYLFSEARCLGYRVDFLLWSSGVQLAIECDGFEFHDRTKQQASYDRARDRELLRVGLHVIRFTGSDIHRDANQCAREIASTWDALARRGGK